MALDEIITRHASLYCRWSVSLSPGAIWGEDDPLEFPFSCVCPATLCGRRIDQPDQDERTPICEHGNQWSAWLGIVYSLNERRDYGQAQRWKKNVTCRNLFSILNHTAKVCVTKASSS
ncbi:hypothetical protein PoB_000969700 [Plakobranchus ocellatus]|uniref:SWIM-type domain-containing protein n=1 Tax=Plakobranchus ocellatus TaxID=259542 RepID=A0AAV3YJZ7_9GAST|nr:hypothetical protein PoB_000969700 [Plakobranchus ocellatus]